MMYLFIVLLLTATTISPSAAQMILPDAPQKTIKLKIYRHWFYTIETINISPGSCFQIRPLCRSSDCFHICRVNLAGDGLEIWAGDKWKPFIIENFDLTDYFFCGPRLSPEEK